VPQPIERDRAETQHFQSLRAPAPVEGSDPRQQLIKLERLGQVVVASKYEPNPEAGTPPEIRSDFIISSPRMPTVPSARSLRAQSEVRDTLGQVLEVRRGDPAEQILAAVGEHRPDVLVLGCHRGGPAGVIEVGSTARHLIHSAPCAVLTVPL